MNKTMMFAAIFGCAIALSGCVSEELTWGGQKAVRQPDGTVLVDQTTGKPYYERTRTISSGSRTSPTSSSRSCTSRRTPRPTRPTSARSARSAAPTRSP